MTGMKSFCFLQKINRKNNLHDSRFATRFYTVGKCQNGIPEPLQGFQPQRGCQSISSSQYISSRNVLYRSKILGFANSFVSKHSMTVSRQFGHSADKGPHLSRDFLAQLWVADSKAENAKRKRMRKLHKNESHGEPVHASSIPDLFGKWFSGASVAEGKSYEPGEAVPKQPPPSQSSSDFLEPVTIEEAKIAPLLARSNLLITRDIEWANLVFGFEQENRYAIVDVCYPQSPAGFIREKSNPIVRQILRRRRPFVAHITDGLGNELFVVRRPLWWINSSIYVEVNGQEIGVVHARWHLWRRIYDLYLGNKQFAVVRNPGLWNWTFTLKDINGEDLAEINRDWRGFGFEIFTDAGQYVIRFGSPDPSSKTDTASVVEDLEVVRPLTLAERAVTVALAISLDNDYFSRHGPGWRLPFFDIGE